MLTQDQYEKLIIRMNMLRDKTTKIIDSMESSIRTAESHLVAVSLTTETMQEELDDLFELFDLDQIKNLDDAVAARRAAEKQYNRESYETLQSKAK